MKYVFISLYVLLGYNVFKVKGEAKCDETIINNIKKLWGDSYPTNGLETEIANGKEVTVGVTSGVFTSDIQCAYNIMHEDSAYRPMASSSIRFVYNNGTVLDYESYSIEYEGTRYDPCVKFRVYYVYLQNGVVGLYRCSEDPNAPCGTPEGIVKATPCNYDAQSVKEAKEVLKQIGVEITKEYPIECN